MKVDSHANLACQVVGGQQVQKMRGMALVLKESQSLLVLSRMFVSKDWLKPEAFVRLTLCLLSLLWVLSSWQLEQLCPLLLVQQP